MKTIVELNGTNYASTGNIALNIAKEARKSGYKVYTFCNLRKEALKYKYNDQIFYGKWLERIISERLSYITGFRDHFNIFSTLDLIKKLKEVKPDLIHMHVLHDNFINYRILFNYLKSINIPIIWTFHECSAFTGQCPYFDMVGCDKWKTGCYNCPQIHIQPKSLIFDTTRKMWNYKKECFTSLNDLTIITPSIWLEGLVKQSFFNSYQIMTINNGIDLNRFKPTESDFVNKYNLSNKYIVLGVANFWNKRKGLDVFIKLAEKLPSNYQIVLIGTNDNIDKLLPNNILSIHRTYNQEELIKIYSCADLFANPTREENLPTVNIEALACGLPVLTFNTGGSPEIIDKTCGSVVDKNDIDAFEREIIRICEHKPYKKESCISRSKLFDMQETYKKYIELFDLKLK